MHVEKSDFIQLFFCEMGVEWILFDSCVAASLEKYQEKQDPR